MQITSWHKRAFYDFIFIDLEGGQRVYLDEKENLLETYTGITIWKETGERTFYPYVKIIRIDARIKNEWNDLFTS